MHLRDGSLETPSLPLRVSKPILVGLTDVRTIFANIDLAFHRKNRTVFFLDLVLLRSVGYTDERLNISIDSDLRLGRT